LLYNEHCRRRSLPHRTTPAAIYRSLPKDSLRAITSLEPHLRVIVDMTEKSRFAWAVACSTSASDEPTPEPQ
jgi:hypothetical protein